MGWFFMNLVLPAVLPLVILLALKLVDLPEPYASRANLLRAVRDGQLGWVAMGFAASCTYELWEYVSGAKAGAPGWAGLVLTISVIFLALSGVLAMAGTLFPFDESKAKPSTWRGWLVYYKLFAATAFSVVLTGVLYALVHYALPA